MDDGGARSAAPSHKRPTLPPDGELAELLWRDGAVVARAHRHHHDQQGSFGRVPSGVTWDAPAATRDSGAPGGDVYAQLWRDVARMEGRAADGDTAASAWTPAARSSRTGGGEVGSSFCGSNAVLTAAPALALRVDNDDTDDDAALPLPGASTSGRPGRSALLKRGRDDTVSRGEDADFQAVDDDETRPGSSKRRTRSAEVHNLSERRRRDRINDKVRALQELVPHCNKTDKASILDEAIEYLKSLQMQVQIMWMSTGVAPMMLPGAHRLMSPMGMGLNSPCMPPTTQLLSQMQRVPPFMNSPLPNHLPGVSSAATRLPNVANQVQENRVAVPRNPFLHPNDAPAATHEMAHHNEIQELLANAAAPAMGVEQPSSTP